MNKSGIDAKTIKQSIEISIRLILVFALCWYCFQIIIPFLSTIIWGLVIAIALSPLFSKLKDKTNWPDRRIAFIITLGAFLFLAVPFYFLITSLIHEFQHIAHTILNDKMSVSLPPAEVIDIPLVGDVVYDNWMLASQHMDTFYAKYESHLKEIGHKMLEMVLGLGSGLLHFVAALIVAGILMAYAKESKAVFHQFFIRIAGKHGEDFSEIAERTVLSVAKGVLGIAVIQALLAGLSFFIAGIPGAGIWTLLCLFLATIQIGIIPVMIPIVIYAFYNDGPLVATLFAVWTVAIIIIENMLKPILLSHGAPVPTAIIFIGVLGGFIAFGIVGMFVGSIIFAISYKLFMVWLEDSTEEVEKHTIGFK